MRSISIVLCTYNGARFLDEQLRTLRMQEGVHEIIAVDDRSTDDTMAVLNEHAAEDPRVKVCWNEQRLGVVANFERAVSLATGEWIAFADQDDVWLPQKMARLREAWNGEACLLHHATHKFRGTPPRQLPARAGETRKYHGRDPRRLLYRNSIVGHTTLVRADVVRQLRPFPAEVPHDWWIGVGAALLGPVQYVDEFLVHYRIHETNTYHRAGSRVQRMRSEHRLRLALLDELDARPALSAEWRPFVRDYRSRLRKASSGRISWPLVRYYWTHAGLYFGDGISPVPPVRRLRRSLAAALAAAGQEDADETRGQGVFGELASPTAPKPHSGWRLATISAVAMVLSVMFWIFRVEAAPEHSVSSADKVVPPATSVAPAAAVAATSEARPLKPRESVAWLPPPPPLLLRAGWVRPPPRMMIGMSRPPFLVMRPGPRPPGGIMRPGNERMRVISWTERLKRQAPLIAVLRRQPTVDWMANLNRPTAMFAVLSGGERLGARTEMPPPPPPDGMPRYL